MAVQAQYPSNVLFLNRALQEGKAQFGNDYSFQPQPGGGEFPFLDQSHMIFNNGGGAGNNPRKRGREIASTKSPISPFFLQPQPSQLIDLTKLHRPQPNAVSTGLGLTFGNNQQIQPPPPQQRQQQQSPSPQSSVLLSQLPDDLETQIRLQGDDIDQFLQSQGEQLRRTLAEKRQRHYRALLGAAEESLSRRLREKEVEVEKASRQHAELHFRAVQLSAEAQVWQARARAQEATAASLQEQLQQAIMCGGARQQDRGDEVRWSGEGGEAEDAESCYIDPNRVVAASEPSCKGCEKRVASVLLLPCRHLCLCTECSALARACPLCLTYKDSSIEVCFS